MSRYLVMPSPAKLGTQHVTSGLVGYWDAGNRSSYAGSGTSWTDLSGSGYTGTILNGGSFSGSHGGGISLDGTNDYVRILAANAPNLLFTGSANYTLEAWCYVSSLSSGKNVGLFCREFFDTTPRGGYLMCFRDTGSAWTIFCARLGNGTQEFVETSARSAAEWTGRWFQCVCTYDGSNIRIYENGSQVASGPSTVSVTNTSNPIEFGKQYTNYLHGTIAVSRAYNRALSASEIAQNYNATRGRFGL